MDIFERAVRRKLRFSTVVGDLTTEDLWDLPLTSHRSQANLDDLARSLNRALKNEDVSFVTDKRDDGVLQLKFDVVKHVIDSKLAERDAQVERVKKAEKRQKILANIANRQDEALSKKSLDELEKELAELDG